MTLLDNWLIRPILTPFARRVLRDRFSRAEIRRILRDTFLGHRGRRSALPREKTVGGRAMVYFAAITEGFYRALLSSGLTEAEARRRTAEVTWRIYKKMMIVPWIIAKLTGRTAAHGRIQRATALFRRFPFGAPSYHMVDVPSKTGTVSFDVHRCPVAEYFRKQGLSELCVEAWCNLDLPLARQWGARLERTGTLAQGAERCDFRWHVESQK
jgi:ubiquinone biosynthesis protein